MKNNDEKTFEWLLDTHFRKDQSESSGQPDERHRNQLNANPEIQRLDQNLKHLAQALASWHDQAPPEGLAERTLQAIVQQQDLNQIAKNLSIEQYKPAQPAYKQSRLSWVLGNLRDLAAVAACLFIVATASSPAFRHARQTARQKVCAANMNQIHQALGYYASEHDNQLPSTKYQPGSRWWHVGSEQGTDTSNTRNLFLLVKHGYAQPDLFLCPSGQGKRLHPSAWTRQRIAFMNDFPCRQQINYSFRLMFGPKPDETQKISGMKNNQIIMADLNPLFADFDSDSQSVLDLTGTSLLQRNSPNHQQRGQNILFQDGSVRFSTTRHMGPELDDIFTIRNLKQYRGNEIPDQDDLFIAP